MYSVTKKPGNRRKTKAFQHIDHAPVRVNRIMRGAAIAAICLILPACTLSSGLGSVKEDQVVTNSVAKQVQPEGIETADAEVIKSVVAEAGNSQSDNLLAWQNPDTGSKGTIMAINRFVGSHGQQCKKFQTTVDTFMGISLYNGETCELKKGFWVLSWFIRKDG